MKSHLWPNNGLQINTENELNDILSFIVDEILECIMWTIVQHQMSVDFDDYISCIATCPEVNNGAGFFVIGRQNS